jgi:hypothetical protein
VLRPKCMPFTYIDGKKKFISNLWPPTTTFNGPAYTAQGYFLPCCFCDGPKHYQEMTSWGFFDEDLHIDRNNSAEDILTSKVWRDWVNMLQHHPEQAPRVCHKKCKLQNDY